MAEQENEEQLQRQIVDDLEILVRDFQDFEMLILFSGEHDSKDAIVTLPCWRRWNRGPGLGGNAPADVYSLGRIFRHSVEILDFSGRGRSRNQKRYSFWLKDSCLWKAEV